MTEITYKMTGKSLFFPREKILVISDLHVGFEEALNKSGIMIPHSQFEQTVSDLDEIFSKISAKKEKVEEVVILGDLKHEFGEISGQEWQESLEILDYFEKKGSRVILIKGNHDTILGPIADKKGIEIKEYYIHNGICFIHGHKNYEACVKNAKMLVMGHMHPAITIHRGAKSEIYKCFLVGEWKKKEIIILPSFFPLVEGSSVDIEYTNLDFEFKLQQFSAHLVEAGEVYSFGRVKDIGFLQ